MPSPAIQGIQADCCHNPLSSPIFNYSGTPVTRPIMGPLSDGHVSEVEILGVNFAFVP
jgi:hypothetical protein